MYLTNGEIGKTNQNLAKLAKKVNFVPAVSDWILAPPVINVSILGLYYGSLDIPIPDIRVNIVYIRLCYGPDIRVNIVYIRLCYGPDIRVSILFIYVFVMVL